MFKILCNKLVIIHKRLRLFRRWINAKSKTGHCDLKIENEGKVPLCSHMQNVGDEKHRRCSQLSA